MSTHSHPPVRIGTKGTVASLILKEIEYLNRLGDDGSKKPEFLATGTASSSRHSTGSDRSETKRKKRRNGLIPAMCSMVDVSSTHQPIGIAGFNYRNLKSDSKKLQA